MKSSDQGIVLAYAGGRPLAIRGVGFVEMEGDTVSVSTREKADRLLSLYNFKEVDAQVAAEEEGE